MSTGTGNERERGREAEVPSEIPRAGWRDVLVRLKDAIREDRITLIAAGVAFYAMLALFPAMEVAVLRVGVQLAQDAAEDPQAPEEARQPAQPVESHAEHEHRERLVPPGHPAAGPHRV